jgi:hypothetical protein
VNLSDIPALLAEAVRRREEKLRKNLKTLCRVNREGKCKYWDVAKFGYDKGDLDAPLDKFFPEEVLSLLTKKEV